MKESELEHISLFMLSFLLDAIEEKIVSLPIHNNKTDFEEWVINWLKKRHKGPA